MGVGLSASLPNLHGYAGDLGPELERLRAERVPPPQPPIGQPMVQGLPSPLLPRSRDATCGRVDVGFGAEIGQQTAAGLLDNIPELEWAVLSAWQRCLPDHYDLSERSRVAVVGEQLLLRFGVTTARQDGLFRLSRALLDESCCHQGCRLSRQDFEGYFRALLLEIDGRNRVHNPLPTSLSESAQLAPHRHYAGDSESTRKTAWGKVPAAGAGVAIMSGALSSTPPFGCVVAAPFGSGTAPWSRCSTACGGSSSSATRSTAGTLSADSLNTSGVTIPGTSGLLHGQPGPVAMFPGWIYPDSSNLHVSPDSGFCPSPCTYWDAHGKVIKSSPPSQGQITVGVAPASAVSLGVPPSTSGSLATPRQRRSNIGLNAMGGCTPSPSFGDISAALDDASESLSLQSWPLPGPIWTGASLRKLPSTYENDSVESMTDTTGFGCSLQFVNQTQAAQRTSMSVGVGSVGVGGSAKGALRSQHEQKEAEDQWRIPGACRRLSAPPALGAQRQALGSAILHSAATLGTVTDLSRSMPAVPMRGGMLESATSSTGATPQRGAVLGCIVGRHSVSQCATQAVPSVPVVPPLIIPPGSVEALPPSQFVLQSGTGYDRSSPRPQETHRHRRVSAPPALVHEPLRPNALSATCSHSTFGKLSSPDVFGGRDVALHGYSCRHGAVGADRLSASLSSAGVPLSERLQVSVRQRYLSEPPSLLAAEVASPPHGSGHLSEVETCSLSAVSAGGSVMDSVSASARPCLVGSRSGGCSSQESGSSRCENSRRRSAKRDLFELEAHYTSALERCQAERRQAMSLLEEERKAWADERRTLLEAFQRQLTVETPAGRPHTTQLHPFVATVRPRSPPLRRRTFGSAPAQLPQFWAPPRVSAPPVATVDTDSLHRSEDRQELLEAQLCHERSVRAAEGATLRRFLQGQVNLQRMEEKLKRLQNLELGSACGSEAARSSVTGSFDARSDTSHRDAQSTSSVAVGTVLAESSGSDSLEHSCTSSYAGKAFDDASFVASGSAVTAMSLAASCVVEASDDGKAPGDAIFKEEVDSAKMGAMHGTVLRWLDDLAGGAGPSFQGRPPNLPQIQGDQLQLASTPSLASIEPSRSEPRVRLPCMSARGGG